MIKVSYEYDFETIAEYDNESDSTHVIIIPRTDEFINIDYITYRVETIRHEFEVLEEPPETIQHVLIKLTRQLNIRSI